MHYLERMSHIWNGRFHVFSYMLNLDLKLSACVRVLVRVLASVCAWMCKCVCMCSRMGEYAFSIAHVSVLSVYACGNQCAHACTYSVYTYV